MPQLLSLNPDGRPRERLESQGPRQLSDAELLAIVLGMGAAGHSVIDVAQGLLARSGGLGGLARASLRELCDQPGGVEVHHVRKLADLARPGTAQQAWEAIMARRRRKTLVVCADCHGGIHASKPAEAFTA